jgi:putative methanogen marker protein 4
MSLINTIIQDTDTSSAKIGIGLGDSEIQNKKILYAAIKVLNLGKERDLQIYFFGEEEFIDRISVNSSYTKYRKSINLVTTDNPASELFNYLNTGTIQAIVRGAISSSVFLPLVKEKLNIPVINRLALLETNSGYQFFYGPVGIDECNDLRSKMNFIEAAVNQLHTLDISPKVSILSGGRLGDIGRDERVDKTINEAKEIMKLVRGIFPSINISHDEILIEKAIENNANLIIAPDGISGNLIYRTLVHLGGGKAFGAIYMGLEKILVDTSRVGALNEIYGAFLLALSLMP